MNYRQMFAKMPQSARDRIFAQTWVREAAEKGLMPEDAFADDTSLRVLRSGLNEEEDSLLRLILVRFGSRAFTPGELEEAAGQWALAFMRSALGSLRACGVIAAFRKSWGDLLYFLPHDGMRAWQRIYFPISKWSEEITGVEASQSSSEQKEQQTAEAVLRIKELSDAGDKPRQGLDLDLFAALSYVDLHELTLTQRGAIHKRHVQKLADRLTFAETDLAGCKLQYPFGDTYSPAVAVALDFLLKLGLAARSADRIECDEEKLREWLHKERPERIGILYKLWREHRIPDTSPLQHLVLLMERVPAGNKQSLSVLVDLLRMWGVVGSAKEADQLIPEAIETWLQPMRAFGWLEWHPVQGGWDSEFEWLIPIDYAARPGTDAAVSLLLQSQATLSNERDEASSRLEEGLFRGLDSADRSPGYEVAEQAGNDSARCLFVQPDFEIMVPPECPLYVRWEVARTAEWLRSDQVAVYRLTKESVQRAADMGISAQHTAALLDRYSRHGLPDPVRVTLLAWGEQYGRVYLADITVLRCADPAVARQIERHPKLQSYVAEKLGEDTFIVRDHEQRELLHILEHAGFSPRKQILNDQARRKPKKAVTAAPHRGEDTGENHPKGLIYDNDPVQYLDLDVRIPAYKELIEGLWGVPAVWYTEYRRYHPSTCLNIIRQAIEWGAVICMKSEEESGRSSVRTLVPKKILHQGNRVFVEGYECSRRAVLGLEEFGSICVRLPGFKEVHN
ncbi:helicase-associated domain-containing protein [Paenibacillus sp. FJAT-26967]|uniref:helicase-associated domain-containing protein n=1 Tax=Paenibacillus sp. FJAT-26967 TaxID=1729690 RepID=UPI000837BA69|nr:helicase-associated domain-containing protein [Paenibacillus sp. FJAT-26967]